MKTQAALLIAAAVALSLWPFAGVRYPPENDFPDHVLITQIAANGAFHPGANYAARASYTAGADYTGAGPEWRSLWAPYCMMYALAAPLAKIAGALVAVKLVMAASMAATAMALLRLLRLFSTGIYGFFLAYPFFFSTAFLLGLLPHLLAVPFALLLLGEVLDEPKTTWKNLPPRLLLGLLAVWAHPVVFAAVAMVITIVLAAEYVRGASAAGTLFAGGAWLAVQTAYMLMNSSAQPDLWISWEHKVRNLRSFFGHTGAYGLAFHNSLFWVVKLPLIAWLLWVAVTAVRPRAGSPSAAPRPRFALVAGAAAFAVLAVLVPESAFGRLIGAAFRFSPFAIALAAAIVPARFLMPPVARALLVTWCFCALGGHVVLAHQFDRQMRAFEPAIARMQPAETAIMRIEGNENRLFLRALGYYHLQKGGLSPDLFLIVGGVRQFPVWLAPPYPWTGPFGDAYMANPLFDSSGSVFRYVVVKSPRAASEQLPDAPQHRLAFRSEDWLLFEREPDVRENLRQPLR